MFNSIIEIEDYLRTDLIWRDIWHFFIRTYTTGVQW